MAQIAGEVAGYREGLLSGEDADPAGARVYRTLFGQLARQEAGKPAWLLSIEGPLFELPFAALPAGTAGVREVRMVEKHSVQIVPGALLLGGRERQPLGPYLGVGDPIYNTADPRISAQSRVGDREQADGMNRLAGSGAEIRRSAIRWRGTSEILEGLGATRDKFLGALSRQVPAVIHLATHVIAGADQRGFVAFSLGPDRRPELLATHELATLHVPSSLVVMTGCASSTGEMRPGAGMLGLTRSWLMAGASAVVGTGWPVPDYRSDLLPAFFRHFPGVSAAEALRRSQVEMMRSGTWQADPAFWAAFQVTGGAR
jgi:CHAT domain-containing protein